MYDDIQKVMDVTITEKGEMEIYGGGLCTNMNMKARQSKRSYCCAVKKIKTSFVDIFHFNVIYKHNGFSEEAYCTLGETLQ